MRLLKGFRVGMAKDEVRHRDQGDSGNEDQRGNDGAVVSSPVNDGGNANQNRRADKTVFDPRIGHKAEADHRKQPKGNTG